MFENVVMHRLGDWHELADWFANPVERANVETKIRATFAEDAENHGLVFSPLEIHELNQGDSRVPTGPVGAKLLRGSAKVVAFTGADGGSITQDIDDKDLEKLRDMTQKIWRKTNPRERQLKVSELDRVINERGVEVIEAMLR